MKNKTYYEAIYEIIRTGHWITDNVAQELKEFGISEPQFNVLRILRGQKGKPLAVEDIGQRMVQRSSNVTRIIDKLLTRKLVTRQECPTNRRKMDIGITSEGLDLLKVLDKKVEVFHQPMFENITAEEAETLTTLIRKLRK